MFAVLDKTNVVAGMISNQVTGNEPPLDTTTLTSLNSGKIAVYDPISRTYTISSPPVQTAAQLLSGAQTARIAYIDQQYETLEHADIAYMGATFQADDVSRKLIAEVLAAQAGVAPLDFAWYDKNNSPVAMTNTQFQGLANAIYLRNRPLYINKQAKKAAIRAPTITTVAAVQAVVW